MLALSRLCHLVEVVSSVLYLDDVDAHFDVLLIVVELRVWSIDFDVKSELGLLSKEDR